MKKLFKHTVYIILTLPTSLIFPASNESRISIPTWFKTAVTAGTCAATTYSIWGLMHEKRKKRKISLTTRALKAGLSVGAVTGASLGLLRNYKLDDNIFPPLGALGGAFIGINWYQQFQTQNNFELLHDHLQSQHQKEKGELEALKASRVKQQEQILLKLNNQQNEFNALKISHMYLYRWGYRIKSSHALTMKCSCALLLQCYNQLKSTQHNIQDTLTIHEQRINQNTLARKKNHFNAEPSLPSLDAMNARFSELIDKVGLDEVTKVLERPLEIQTTIL